MDDFNFFSDQDRRDISYFACLGGSTALGMSVGRLLMLPGILAGAATGLAFGLLACKRLSPAIEDKIFATQESLNESELLATLRLIRDLTGAETKSEAMYLLEHVRAFAKENRGLAVGDVRACKSPRHAAHEILSLRERKLVQSRQV